MRGVRATASHPSPCRAPSAIRTNRRENRLSLSRKRLPPFPSCSSQIQKASPDGKTKSPGSPRWAPSSPLSGSLGTCPGKEPSDAAQPWEAGPTDKMEAFYRQGYRSSEVKKTAQEHAAAKCLQSGFSFRNDPEASHTSRKVLLYSH